MLNIQRTCLSGTALLVLGAGFVCAQAADPPPNAEAIRILTDSPWSKKVQATVMRPVTVGNDDAGMGGGGGRGGAGMGGMTDSGSNSTSSGLSSGDGMSMGGGGGRGGRGGRGGGGGGGQMPATQSRIVLLRWESAAPVRQALEATSKVNASAAAAHADYYSIAALVPGARLGGKNPEEMNRLFREKATLKIRGKKITPERVEISERADGMIVYYLFPRAEAITVADKDVEFSALMGPMEIKTKFHPKEMVSGDKLEL